MKVILFLFILLFGINLFITEPEPVLESYEKISNSEREKVFNAISKIDVLIDFYDEDVRKFTNEESPEKLREYLLSLTAMRVKMKLMMRLPFQLTDNLKELQELKDSLHRKSLEDLVEFVESEKI